MLAFSRLAVSFRALRVSSRENSSFLKITRGNEASQRFFTESQDPHTSETLDYMLQVHKPTKSADQSLTGVRHKMRGRFNITKTKWWLEQGPILMEQVSAINLEYNKPASDEYGFSRGAYNYHNYFIPQLRYKNPHVQIDVNNDQVAVPFMTLYFKDGRSATINCAASAEEIARHLQATFCVDNNQREDDDFDENGRLKNPWMHANNKPCRTATKNRLHRKCICQQPGHFGCKTNMHNLVQMPERKALTQRSSHNLPVEDSWYVNYLNYTEVLDNPRGKFHKYRYLRVRHEDKRPWRSPENFRNYCTEIQRVEQEAARQLARKMKGHSDFKLVKRLSHKMVHEYWSTWFWQCEPGLGPNMEEVKKQLKLRTIFLSKRDIGAGGHSQVTSRSRWNTGIPYYA